MIVTFYVPFPDAPLVEKELNALIVNGRLQYAIYVKRVSMHGNPYIKGLLVSQGSDIPPFPQEVEIEELPPGCLEFIWSAFKTEEDLEGNAVELGSIPSSFEVGKLDAFTEDADTTNRASP